MMIEPSLEEPGFIFTVLAINPVRYDNILHIKYIAETWSESSSKMIFRYR